MAYCWGFGVGLGDGSRTSSATPVEVSGASRYVKLYVGDQNACALTLDGAAYCWGDNSRGQL
ncbi:MAG TPA: RCC1 domain-containing protein, partial [Gemmatimonadaceae bacterium]|nr:RCC1 domain-containing protein [Gemmatimonadaceae bacterium]